MIVILRKRFFTVSLVVLAVISSVVNLANALGEYESNLHQQDFILKQGLIDVDNIAENSYHKGTVQVKLAPEVADLIGLDILTAKNSYAVTGIKSLDALNKKFNIIEYRPLLHDLYEISEKSLERAELHQKWGLNLWYDLIFDDSIDVVKVVKAFEELPEVLLVEPLLKKVQIEPYDVRELPADTETHINWTPNDQLFNALQWSLNNTGQSIQGQEGLPGADIRAVEAWDIERGYSDVIVAIFDNGMDYDHEDLEGNVWDLIGPQGTNTPQRDNGTRIAGIISAVTNNGIGIAGIAGGSGHSDGVRVMACNIVNTTITYLSRKTYAADNGAAISQNNWRYVEPGQANQSDITAINYFNSNGGGRVLDGGITIFAAGNENNNQEWYPPFLPQTIAVASIDNRNEKSNFSNYGEWIDLSAPGTNITSTTGNDEYSVMSSTAMAAPHISGTAALIISYAYRNGIILENHLVREILRQTADDIDEYNPFHGGYLGAGRVNAYDALRYVRAGILDVANPTNFTAVADSNNIHLSWQLNQNNNEVMIVWSREPVEWIPQDEVNYQPGQIVDQGVQVLHWGFDTDYYHYDLSAGRRYYYKAFSILEDMTYSSGVHANAALAPPNYTLPFCENFDDEDEFPALWQVVDQFNNNTIWSVGTFADGIEDTSGNYAYINGEDYGAHIVIGSQLISPTIDMSDAESVTVRFKNSLSAEEPNLTGNFFVSHNNGVIWTHIDIWTETTDNPATFARIIPIIAGQPEVKLRWDFYSMSQGHWCIDDIEVFETRKFPPHNFRVVPSVDFITVQWNAPHETDSLMYNIYRNGDLLNDEPIEGLFYTDYDVVRELTYSYRATSIYPDGESLPTNVIHTRLLDPEPIEVNPPRNISASIQGADVFLKWQIPENMEPDSLLSYRIYRNNNILNQAPVTDTSYVDEDLDITQTYIYFLTTLYGDEESEASDSVTVVFTGNDPMPDNVITSLDRNYPNPFNPNTTIRFSLAEESHARLEVFSIKGNRVALLTDSVLPKGIHNVVWNGSSFDGKSVGSGIYFYRLKTPHYESTGKMILIK